MRRAAAIALACLGAAGCGGGNAVPQSGPVSWAEAQRLILGCHVTSGEVLHSRRLTLELDNGARVTTDEPPDDDVFRVLREADPKCPGPKTFSEE